MMEHRQSVSIPVSGMSCASCVGHVEKALTALPGVTDVVVSLGTNRASLSYDPQQVDVTDVKIAIECAGYQVPTTEVTLDVRGMSCASCVAHVEGALQDLPGVEIATVNLGLGTARIKYIPDVVNLSAMKQAVKNVGYEASERSASPVDAVANAYDRERPALEEEIRRQGRNLLVAGLIGLIVMIGTFYNMLGPLKAFVPEFLSYKWIIGLLTTP